MLLLLTAAVTVLPGAIVIALVLARRRREARLAARIARLRRNRRAAQVVWLRAGTPAPQPQLVASGRMRSRRASA